MRDQLEAWVKPQVKAWAHRVRVLGKISQRHPQSAYAGLGMLLQLKRQYLQRNVPRVGTLMVPIEEALREKTGDIYLSLFISDTPGQEEAEKQVFLIKGLSLNFVSGSRYLGA